MELLWFLALSVATFVGIYWVNVRAERRSAVRLDIDPADVAELDAVAQRLLWERLNQRSASLARRLRTIISRGIPPRGLTPADEKGQWVLTFADGSGLRVKSLRPGEVTDLLVHISRGRATLLGHTFQGDDVLLEFAAGPRMVRVVALSEA